MKLMTKANNTFPYGMLKNVIKSHYEITSVISFHFSLCLHDADVFRCLCPCHQVEHLKWSSTRSSLSWTGTVCWDRKRSSFLTWSQRRTPATLIVRFWVYVEQLHQYWVYGLYNNFPDTVPVTNAHFYYMLTWQLIYYISSPSHSLPCQPVQIVIITSIRTTRMTPMTMSRWRSGSFLPALLASARSD